MAEELREQAGAGAAAASMELSDFDKLINEEFKPKSEEADRAVKEPSGRWSPRRSRARTS